MIALAEAASAAPALPPHLGPNGQAEYREFIEAPNHKAFAIAPGGAWGWTVGEMSAKAAEEKALANCRGQTGQRCVSYAIDDRTVFDAVAWPLLWRPYASAGQAVRAAIGREVGQRMVDLAFADVKGIRRTLSSLRGKVVVLHFWGAWCPPCRQEMPDLQSLHKSLGDNPDIAFVLLQAREPFATSRSWAERQGIVLPLFDSGSMGDEDAQFRLANGGRIKDREVAGRFPTTYVLDKRGVIVFSHIGPVHDWPAYAAFLRDAVRNSGR